VKIDRSENMYHKCVKCERIYEQDSAEIINGCVCGSKLFYFIRCNAESVDARKKKNTEGLTSEDIDYFYELEDDENHEIIIFDIEAINIKSSGKYELNIDGLMSDDGLIYKYGEGKYSIDLDSNLKRLRKKR
jgi:predicted  nucleic acid-binding Zn-ribbon protein